VRATWVAAPPYSAEGVEEKVISFKNGVELLLGRGAYELMEKKLYS